MYPCTQAVQAHKVVRRRSFHNRLTDGDEVVGLTRMPRFTAQKDFLILISVRD
jgi:hypothetical protein